MGITTALLKSVGKSASKNEELIISQMRGTNV